MQRSVEQQKRLLRDQLRSCRSQLQDRAAKNRLIEHHLTAWRPVHASQVTAVYVSVRDEVDTHAWIRQRLQHGPSLPGETDHPVRWITAVPYCAHDRLQLFRLEEWTELGPGRFGVPEPDTHLRDDDRRAISPGDVDLFIVPGVGFDWSGRRLGYGGGYFDRLLLDRKPGSIVVGLAFHCQLVSELPDAPHDQRVEWVITEYGVHDCRNGSLAC